MKKPKRQTIVSAYLDTDSTVSPEECEAISKAWARAAAALRLGKHGKITASDHKGFILLWIEIAYRGKSILSLIQDYKALPSHEKQHI